MRSGSLGASAPLTLLLLLLLLLHLLLHLLLLLQLLLPLLLLPAVRGTEKWHFLC